MCHPSPQSKYWVGSVTVSELPSLGSSVTSFYGGYMFLDCLILLLSVFRSLSFLMYISWMFILGYFLCFFMSVLFTVCDSRKNTKKMYSCIVVIESVVFAFLYLNFYPVVLYSLQYLCRISGSMYRESPKGLSSKFIFSGMIRCHNWWPFWLQELLHRFWSIPWICIRIKVIYLLILFISQP